MVSTEEDALAVSVEFLEENKHVQLGTTRKNGGPYSRGQRRKRRQEVFRLHYLEGIPAIRIADLMKVNKNTITDDIRWLQTRMLKEIEGEDWDGYFTKQIVRLELQRTRLLSYLSEAKDLSTKLVVERQLADLDLRLASLMEKFKHNYVHFWDEVMKRVNEIAKEEKLDHGYSTIFERVRLSPKARKMLDEIKKEESEK